MKSKSILFELWRQQLAGSKWWTPSELDGLHVEALRDGYALRAVAYLHICRRCLHEMPRAAGDRVLCGGCKLHSHCIYRMVRVYFEMPRDGEGVAGLMRKIGALHLRDLHPAIVPTERLEIDLTKWDDFAASDDATWWSAVAE